MVTLKLRSPGNASSSPHAANDVPQGRNGPRGMEMFLSDVKDRVLRDKLGELQTDYPLTPLMFLMYTLLKCDQDLKCARTYLRENKSARRDVTSIPVTSLHAIRNVNIREKVREITESLGTTVWWTVYALRVCNGSVDQASGLLTEGVIDATIDPWWSGMNMDTDNEIFTESAEAKVETPKFKTEPKVSASLYGSPALGDWIGPPISPNANNDTGRKKEKLPFMFKSGSDSKTGRVFDDSSDDEMTLPPAKDDSRETSDTEGDRSEAKIGQMMDLLPHLTPSDCMSSLALSGGEVSEAISLELDLREESVVDHGPRTRPSPSSSPAFQPQKRKSSTPDDRLRKKLCFHDNEKDAAVLPEAGQWVRYEQKFQHRFLLLLISLSLRSIFHQLAGTTVTINLADEQTREIPQGLLIEHSSYFRERLEGNGKQPAVTEIDLMDVNCIMFDLVIQYMVCRNVSFGDIATMTSGFIRAIINLLVLSTRLVIQGMSTVLVNILEDTLKEARKNATTSSILKAVHIHKAYANFGKHHPLLKLLVKACVRPYMEAGITYNNSDSSSDADSNSDGSESDDEEEKVPAAIDMDVISKQHGYLVYKFIRAFKIDLILAADKTRRNRVSRPRKTHSKNFKDVVTWYTDPLDSEQFTL
ncbi:hypothetical protein CJF31_00010260 [Rutstroemia sp. NJR-2017a BVV2]|nr:hypothetical protein CJF31_00010260 [Rutstroemia sp. NJR-2017a BVV2]